jgi:hypothetical protein
MKRTQVLLPLIVGALLCQSAHAVVWKSSQIVGYATGNLGVVGTGDIDGWNSGTATPEITVTNGSGSLDGTALGLVASAGDKVFLGPTSNTLSARIQFVPNSTFPQTVETNIYYSFLYKFKNAADVSTVGEPIARVNRANSGAGTAQHWDLIAKNVAGQIQLGLFKANGTATNYAATNITAGSTIFVVVRQHIITGAQNDVYDLWINPPSEYYGTNEVDIPASLVTVGAVTTDGTEDSSSTGPGRLTLGSGVNSEFDELRIASTWADATPRFGSCVGAAIETQPTNVTQCAEISASFVAAALSTATAPTYQWQRSTNAGSTWFNISGATGSRYTTPNLAQSDSGSLYRAIVNVACNNSSATSAVASVTLTNPVVSSVGTVLYDTFADGFRDDAPVSSANSLWYTAVLDNLQVQSENLVALPVSGGSSLWLGYFIDTNLPPVHLAVGRTIKVTLPFVANSYANFTNNSSLRLGLFDYYDAGARITQDGSSAGGSQGLGTGVRGYMLNLDFGPTFAVNSPVQLLARSFLPDINLMGSIGDYDSFGSGPAGGGYIGATAFQAGTQYTLEFTVARTGVNTANVTATITGGGTNWSHTITDTNYVYHRFDAFGIRPNSMETSADGFTFSEFKVEVLQGLVPVNPFSITSVQALAADSIKLTWQSQAGASYHILSSPSLGSPNWTTNGTVAATGSSTSYTNTPVSGAERYYRVVGLPYTP